VRGYAVAALLILAPCAASAQSMNAETFHKRAAALQAKGVMALFSGSEIKSLRAEGEAAGDRAAAGVKADRAAGRTPRFCPPPGPRNMGNNEFMQRLSAIPAAQRAHIDMTEAMNRILAVKFPCRR
jgi:hypothetical protein